ncbi:MAG: M50 family metallopeptidase [Acidobacteria bacterium]|nr:M50 family metallopeptidase [Acidobacteriota bacterium]MCW5949512.1 M50 family metallopeptidase [Pyrinomonadaceae bacterium]
MEFRYTIGDDARPQVKLLTIATVLTIILWFVPFAEYLVYPFRLFVTFIHEGGHALVSLLTGGSVQSLTVAADGSGVVFSAPSGRIGQLLTSSAGYLGTSAFGVLLLYLIRRRLSPNILLAGCGIIIGLLTVVFGIVSPAMNLLSLNVGLSSVMFTVLAGVSISSVLLIAAKFASQRTAAFAAAFLAVQCLMNALSDLKTLVFINAPLVGSDIQTDAANMSAASGIPGFVWAVLWLLISLVLVVVGLRMFASLRSVSKNDSLFND